MAPALRNGRAVAAVAPAPVICAVYCRKSTDENLDSAFNSLDAQRESCFAYISSQKHQGWLSHAETFEDAACSGGTLERPSLKRLLAEIQAKRIQCVLVYRSDRLSRRILDFLRLMEVFDQYGVAFVSITEQFNTSTPGGRLYQHMLLSFAEYERGLIGERTRHKIHAARKRGQWTGGMPPLGYDVAPEGGKLLVNKAEAELVRAIFHLFLERQSLVGTAQELNRRGLRRKSWTTKKGTTREGAGWDRVNLRRLLTDSVYIGMMKLGNEAFRGEHEGIVTKGIFERVQTALEANGRDGNSGVRNRSGAILRGLLRCTACASAMTPAHTKKKGRFYRYYTCSKAMKRGHDTCPTKSLPAAEVEEYVVSQIRAIGKDPGLCRETFRQTLAQVAAQRRGLKAESKRVAGEIGKAREEVDRLVGAVSAASNGAREALLAALEKAQRHLTTLENRAEEIRGQEECLRECQVDEGEVARTLAAFDPIWEVLHTPEKERILRLVLEKVTYDGRTEDLTLAWRLPGFAILSTEVAAGGNR